ncbi:MAG TPA: rRNA adenine N-6-methyltransferase family protein [Pseudonocardiaceae bacterium]|nr:rRNA adenine N-6-methyltransferase family protein [Pseudonocardiaceae bacterium]
MTSPTIFSSPVQAALDSVDEDGYTKRPDGTRVPQSFSPLVIARMLDLLDIEPGMRVLEIGTGSGYSTALLSQLVGDDGHITSVEIDRTLTARAEQLLRHHGRHNADLITGDGVKGAPGCCDHFHRVIAWATVEQIPGAWAVQAAPGAILVTPINLTGLPKTHAVVRARYDATIPGFAGEKLIPGGFVEAHDLVIDQWLVPPLGVDVLARDGDDKPWWLSAQWLRTRSSQQAGRDLLDQLITDSRTVPGPLTAEENGADFYAYLLAARPQGLTTAALGDPIWRIGYSNPTGAALIPTGEGQIAVHAGDPLAHHKLLGWAERWRSLGRPGYAHLRPQLDQDESGWHVRATLD